MSIEIDRQIGTLMPKAKQLPKKIRKAAKQQGVSFRKARSWSNHDIWHLDDTVIPIPRHTEILEITAEEICKEYERVLGKDWWTK